MYRKGWYDLINKIPGLKDNLSYFQKKVMNWL